MRRQMPRTLTLVLVGVMATAVVAISIFGAFIIGRSPGAWRLFRGAGHEKEAASGARKPPSEDGTDEGGDRTSAGEARSGTGPSRPATSALAREIAALREELAALRSEIREMSGRLVAQIDDAGTAAARRADDRDAETNERAATLADVAEAVKAARESIDQSRDGIEKLGRAVGRLRENVGELQISVELIEKEIEKQRGSRRRP